VDAIDGPIGYTLEAKALHPIISSLTVTGLGGGQAAALMQFVHTHGSPELDFFT